MMRGGERISVTDDQTQLPPEGADDASTPPEDEVMDALASDEPAGVDTSRWSAALQYWQAPALILGLGLIAGGVHYARREAPPPDFEGALSQVDRMIAAGDHEKAAERLRDVIQPHLDEAASFELAHYYATMGDWFAVSQSIEGVNIRSANQQAAEFYRLALERGRRLSPAQFERWGRAATDLDDMDTAAQRLTDLERIALDGEADEQEEARVRRDTLLRYVVERRLQRGAASPDVLIEALGRYRTSTRLSVEDQLWAAERQARLRLAAGEPAEAAKWIAIDLRRIESLADDPTAVNFATLYALLGQAQYDLGDETAARRDLETALTRFDEMSQARGETVILLGLLDLAAADLDAALARFEQAIRDYESTPVALAARLGRAETRAAMNLHQAALEDFAAVGDTLADRGPTAHVDRDRVVRSLVTQADASIALDELDIALRYITQAEAMYVDDRVAPDVLIRAAAVSRELGASLLRAGGNAAPPDRINPGATLDPGARRQANALLKRAGEYYIRHARAIVAAPGSDQQWEDSLWWGADSYDLAGWHDLAIAHFKEFIAGSEGEEKRPEALFRIAQGYHATQDCPSALEYYAQVLDAYPTSIWASRSYVPLARCAMAMGDVGRAQRELEAVVSGRRGIDPESADYREALIDLGDLYYDQALYVEAIETLDLAARRYPEDDRILDIRFRIADSSRRAADAIETELEQGAMPSGEKSRLRRLRVEYLQTAQAIFADVAQAYEKITDRRLRRDELQNQRYAHLYRADCAFDLGDYEAAIDLYGVAARKYHNHYASMTALIQIVACHHALGQTDKARVAHARALMRLRQLPEGAFQEPDALFDREAWRRWLETTPAGLIAASPTP